MYSMFRRKNGLNSIKRLIGFGRQSFMKFIANQQFQKFSSSFSVPFTPVRLAYNTYEPIGGVDASLSPVIFLHGIGAFKENWGDIPQNIANATKRRAYTLDARNHGDSEWSDEFNFNLNTYDLLHFLENEKISKSILIGHSMGGIASIKASLMQPEKFEKIIIEDMYVKKVPKEIFDAVASYFTLSMKAIETVPNDLDEDGVKKFIMDYIHSNLPPEVQEKRRGDRESEDSHILKLKKLENGRYTFKANVEVVERELRNFDTIMSSPAGKYEGPAFFIYGKLSPFKVDSEEEAIKEHFPNATFEGIEEATHTVHADNPIEFTDAVLKFIA